MIDANLEKIQFEKKLELEVEGWNPITVEYVVRAYSGISWLVWKVSGTEQIFKIQYHIVVMNHMGDLKDHFDLALKTFREDYKMWEKTGFEEEWMKRYSRMFQNLIK